MTVTETLPLKIPDPQGVNGSLSSFPISALYKRSELLSIILGGRWLQTMAVRN